MSHIHSVYDTDTHFIIDGTSREVSNATETKKAIFQGDHNSERLTFQLPRTIDGHDMTECNAVLVHWNNIDAETREQVSGSYAVKDLKAYEKDEEVAILSWLIDGNATTKVGVLAFSIRFSCVDDDSNVTYAWNTAIHTELMVKDSNYNGEIVATDYADILAEWEARIAGLEKGVADDALSMYSTNPVQNKVITQEISNIGTRISGVEKTANSAENIAKHADNLASSVNQQVATNIEPRLKAVEQNGGGYTTQEVDGYAFAVGDEIGNIAFGVRDSGKVVFDKGDYETYETDEYAYAVCDEQGNVVFAITHDGEVKYFGKGEGGTSVAATFDYKKCGLPILSFQEKEAGAHQAMIDAIKKDPDDKIEKAFTYVAKSPKGFVTPAIAAGDCTLKFQGSSSCRNQYPKYNYTFKAKTNTKNEDPEDPKFEATKIIGTRNGELLTMGNWGAQKKYCLKANWIDPSNARNVVNARLWASIVKSRSSSKEADAADTRLLAAPNCGAINGFPVIIELNGEFRGLYTFNIPKEDWMFNGVNGEGDIKYIVGGESNSMSACGFKAEATFVDGGSQADTDFAIEYIPDGVDDQTLIDSFNEAINAVINANGAGWESDVEPYFDVTSAIDYYIFACCIAGEDNLQKNILYATYGSDTEDGHDKWFMSAYDLDTTMGSNPYGTSVYEAKAPKTQSFKKAAERHRLFKLIYDYSKDKLKARYKELRSSVLSDENVWYMYNNFVNCIPRAVYNMDAERWADKVDKYYYPMPATTTANVENYMQYYQMHTALLDKEMEE